MWSGAFAVLAALLSGTGEPSPEGASVNVDARDLSVSAVKKAIVKGLAGSRTEAAEVARAYRKLFQSANDVELRELARSSNASVALQARWELRNRLDFDDFSPSAQGRIPGFFEGELGLEAPLRWGLMFSSVFFSDADQRLAAQRYYHGAGCPGIRPDKTFEHLGAYFTTSLALPVHPTALGGCTEEATRIRIRGDTLTIQVGEHQISVKKRLFSDSLAAASVDPRCAALIAGQHCFVAVFESSGLSFPLTCVDTTTGQLVWRQVVWAAFPVSRPQMTGPFDHEVHLSIGDGVVGVFGLGPGSQYIEAFQCESGKSVLRFSTSYWRGAEPGQLNKSGPITRTN